MRPAPLLRGILLAAAIVLVAMVAAPIWQPLFVAAVFAAALAPWHARVTALFGGRPRLASLAVTLALLLLVLGPLSAAITVAVQEAAGAARVIRDALRGGGAESLIARLPDRAGGWLRAGLDRLPQDAQDLQALAEKHGWTGVLALGGALTAGAQVVVQLVFFLVALYLLLIDGRRLAGFVAAHAPRRAEVARLLEELGRSARSVIASLFVTALAQAGAATIGYFIARVPHPLFFGLLTFLAAFIPSVGTTIVALPLAGLLLALGHPWWALFLALWALLVVGLIDNVVKPLLMKGGMQLHGGLVFFALVGGIAAFGAVGLLVGPLALALLAALLRLSGEEARPQVAIAPAAVEPPP